MVIDDNTEITLRIELLSDNSVALGKSRVKSRKTLLRNYEHRINKAFWVIWQPTVVKEIRSINDLTFDITLSFNKKLVSRFTTSELADHIEKRLNEEQCFGVQIKILKDVESAVHRSGAIANETSITLAEYLEALGLSAKADVEPAGSRRGSGWSQAIGSRGVLLGIMYMCMSLAARLIGLIKHGDKKQLKATEKEEHRIGSQPKEIKVDVDEQTTTQQEQKTPELEERLRIEEVHGTPELKEQPRPEPEKERPPTQEPPRLGELEQAPQAKEQPKLEGEQEIPEAEERPSIEEEEEIPEEDEPPSVTLSKRPKPIHRGGRGRGPQYTEQEPEPVTSNRQIKPEIVCSQAERQWILAVEVPKYMQTDSGLEVLQEISHLKQDESSPSYWRLEYTQGDVVIRWNSEEKRIALGKEGYLLFKLGAQDSNQGRIIKYASHGSYLIVVPYSWDRDEDLSGPPPIAPQSVSIYGYRAHFFTLEGDSSPKIAFRIPGNKQVVIKSRTSRFELVGTRLRDGSEGIGPLFGGNAPVIRSLDSRTWEQIGTIVVGEEGGGRSRWRTEFIPVPGRKEQNLPPKLTARRSGWYFLRFYDTKDDLVESLDFRFICSLKDIRIIQASPLPPGDGHEPVCVEFSHDANCFIRLKDSSSSRIDIEEEDSKTIATIPPDPNFDKTRWHVAPDNGRGVEVVTVVDRVWWTLAEEGANPSDWGDKPITITRGDLLANSKKAIWLRLPQSRWIDVVQLGFHEKTARAYSIRTSEQTVAIPLRDFCDCQEARTSLGVAQLKLWCSRGGTTYTAGVCKLVGKLGCRFCDIAVDCEEAILSHLESSHLDECFRGALYEELREHNHSLPRAIYKCSYCSFYVQEDNAESATTQLDYHITRECKKADRSGGPSRIQFSPIRDVDEIRSYVIKDLPHVEVCIFCNCHLRDASTNKKMEHLKQKHKTLLYNFC